MIATTRPTCRVLIPRKKASRISIELPAPAAENVPVPPAESFGHGSSRSATGSSPAPSRNPFRNSHCGNPAAVPRSARKRRPPQTDLVAALSLLPRTSARPPRRPVNVAPKTLPQIAHKMLKLLCCRCTFRHGCKSPFFGKLVVTIINNFLHPLSFYTQSFTSPLSGVYLTAI